MVSIEKGLVPNRKPDFVESVVGMPLLQLELLLDQPLNPIRRVSGAFSTIRKWEKLFLRRYLLVIIQKLSTQFFIAHLTLTLSSFTSLLSPSSDAGDAYQSFHTGLAA